MAGNFVNPDMLGSVEFACKVLGAKPIVVLSHEHCGAVKGAINVVELGNSTAMVEKIKPAVKSPASHGSDKTSVNEEFVHLVAQKNVQLNSARIRQESPILQEMEAAGQIGIVGAMYNVSMGEVDFMETQGVAGAPA